LWILIATRLSFCASRPNVISTNLRRFWTGTTWSFNVDNLGGAIEAISTTVAAELAKVRDEIRSYTNQ